MAREAPKQPTSPQVPPSPPPKDPQPPLMSPSSPSAPGLVRPSTSGTEAALKISTRLASARLKEAERAERSYKARKRAAAARANRAEAAHHLREARIHLSLGVRLMWSAAKSMPYVAREKWDARETAAEQRKTRKAEEKKRRLEEKLARVSGVGTRPEGESGGEEDGGQEEEAQMEKDEGRGEGIKVVQDVDEEKRGKWKGKGRA